MTVRTKQKTSTAVETISNLSAEWCGHHEEVQRLGDQYDEREWREAQDVRLVGVNNQTHLDALIFRDDKGVEEIIKTYNKERNSIRINVSDEAEREQQLKVMQDEEDEAVWRLDQECQAMDKENGHLEGAGVRCAYNTAVTALCSIRRRRSSTRATPRGFGNRC